MTLDKIYENPLVLTDVYNLSHSYLKENVDYEISNICNRSRSMILYGFNETVNHLLNRQIDVGMVMEAEECANKMGMKFPVDMWMNCVDRMKGYIPLKVEALPDGTWVPKGTPFAQVTNTEEGFGELVTWWEGVFLHTSFPSACATRAMEMRRYLDDNNLPIHKLHSFGFRGHRSMEDAYWATTAWNLFLEGTDDFHGIYHCPNAPLSSIPATAHKTIQQFDSERQGYLHAIDEAKDHGHKAVALVIDTYDPLNFIHHIMRDIFEHAERRKITVVLRPDSGDLLRQVIIIYGMVKLWEFNNVSMIIGEGMSLEKVKEFDDQLKLKGIPLEFVSYGVGSGYYNDLSRDYLGFAMKTSYSNGKNRMKLTKSNPFKRSIPGCVQLIRNDYGNIEVDYTKKGLYKIVYEMDERSSRPKVNIQRWDDIKKIANSQTCIQEEIILSSTVESNIKEFERRYLHEEMSTVQN